MYRTFLALLAVSFSLSAADKTYVLKAAPPLPPALIDAHPHLTYPYERDYRVEELNALKKNIPERTLDAVDIVRRTLMAGFTTVRDVGAGDYIDVGLRNAIAAGKIPGPRMLVAVNAIGA